MTCGPDPAKFCLTNVPTLWITQVGKMQDGPSLWTDFVSKAPELRA